MATPAWMAAAPDYSPFAVAQQTASGQVANLSNLCYHAGMDQEPRVCDYEDSSYRTDFWEGQGREYEDLAERIALRRLLPPTGQRVLDIGGGFGRLSEFYGGYEQAVVLDYSRSLLRQAQERLGRSERMVYVAANFYAMPFADGAFDAAMMVRVMHHVEKVPALLGEVARILTGGGVYVLEFASKRNLKAILRYALRRQPWSPFDPEPHEFVEMNYNFHPDWMQQRLGEAMFHVKRTLTVSHFRQPLLKRLLPATTLATVDGWCQLTGEWWQLTPSVFVQCTPQEKAASAPCGPLFRCPACGSSDLSESPQALACAGCLRRWPIEDGIYNFKESR
jgi:SAM-dependent methyltransferase